MKYTVYSEKHPTVFFYLLQICMIIQMVTYTNTELTNIICENCGLLFSCNIAAVLPMFSSLFYLPPRHFSVNNQSAIRNEWTRLPYYSLNCLLVNTSAFFFFKFNMINLAELFLFWSKLVIFCQGWWVMLYLFLLGMTPICSLSPWEVTSRACHHSSSEALMTCRMSPYEKLRPWLGRQLSLVRS